MSHAIANEQKRVRGRASTRRPESLPLGNDSKRGSFASLVERIELADVAAGAEPTLSSAAFRAGTIVRMMRKSRGLSQTALAKKLGVTQARVSELEAGIGTRGPSWDLMERIARACDATILISPTATDIAIDAAEPTNPHRHWTLAASGA